MAKVGVIIVAGGAGQRMGASLPKQFMLLGNQPILARTINTFHEALPKAEIVVVLPKEHVALWENLAARFDIAPHHIAQGGAERFHSVKSGIEALQGECDYIAVHDAVRPLASKKLIIKLVLQAEQHDAVIPTVGATDSLRRVVGDSSEIINRNDIRLVQTPQLFKSEILRESYRQEYQPQFTDDASVVECAGYKVILSEGERENIKITTPVDLTIAEAILNQRDAEEL